MLDHVSITVPNFVAAEGFYDAVLAALSIVKIGSDPAWIVYGQRCDAEHPGRSYLSIRLAPHSNDAPGRHWCFKAPSRSAVNAFWKAGILHDDTDNGPPGIRAGYHPSYYAAFLMDPAGNCVEAVCHHEERSNK